MLYGCWHPYKYLVTNVWRCFHSLFVYYRFGRLGVGKTVGSYPKLRVMQRTFAGILKCVPHLLRQLRTKSIAPTTGRRPHVETKKEHQGNPGSIGIGKPRGTALSIRLEVCSPHKQAGKHANKVNATFHMFTEASPAEKVPLHDWDVLWFRIPLGAREWKAEAPSPKARRGSGR